ncbi:MAG: hypothetical protein LBO72_04795 [Helicobacteraceae bacterium]|jgi:hypothetical protein|nr:hypothetical protein [Helicobacteraceae bacterium]
MTEGAGFAGGRVKRYDYRWLRYQGSKLRVLRFVALSILLRRKSLAYSICAVIDAKATEKIKNG